MKFSSRRFENEYDTDTPQLIESPSQMKPQENISVRTNLTHS